MLVSDRADLLHRHEVEVVALLASAVHRYDGRPGDGAPVASSADAREVLFVKAGLGIVGDRYYARPAHRRASVTVMSVEALEEAAERLHVAAFDPLAARRNVVLRGACVDRLAGASFSIDCGDGPVELQGHRPATPCGWLDVALAPGAQGLLRGRGGVRCEPLSSGTLRLGPAVLRSAIPLG